MNNRILKRLVSYFTSVLFIFSIVISLLFTILFQRYTTNLHKEELINRANKISNTLSDYYKNSSPGEKKSGNGIGSYIKNINDIAMSEIWLVNKDSQTISLGNGKHSISYGELPENAEILIDEVFSGKTAVSNDFSAFFKNSYITIGTPVYGNNNEIVATLLLHENLNGIEQAYASGLQILMICLVIALIVSIIIGIFLSYNFVKPLNKISLATKKLINKDYKAQTNVVQKDEIGSLAKNVDELSARLYKSSLESIKLENLRNDFISTISHELRTPVTVIRGSLEALDNGMIKGEEEVNEYYKQMLLETINLQRLINDLLELTRLQNTDFSIDMTDVNLMDIISDSIRSVRQSTLKKNIEIIYRKNKEFYMILGDYGRLRQMFMIILENAVKFSNENSKIEINVEIEPNIAKVSITDYGCGISKEDFPYIFEKFYYSKSKYNPSGTGLGLSIAKQIALRHGIELTCQSVENKQTSFIFVFHEKSA